MELPSQEGEMPLPLSSTYGGGHGHMIHNDHPVVPASSHNHIIIPSSAPPPHPQAGVPSNGLIPSSTLDQEHHVPFKKMVKYRECLKNHAASMGGNATDGCGEFMPSGEEGTLEALTCSACNCHRNFHRKEIEGDQQHHLSSCDCFHCSSPQHLTRVNGRKVIVGHHHKSLLGGYPTETTHLIPSRGVVAVPPQQHHPMIMSYNMQGSHHSLPSESDEQDEAAGGNGVHVFRPSTHHHQMVKKRFRTKFTPEQKEKMLNFAEKAGWKIQKQEESVVQQFCQEVGIKRRVLKVWMHNNKHNLAKKNNNNNNIGSNSIIINPHTTQV
ncbi:hypothetical protein ACH5RR_001827 [Cinchona calisaya]|uniref:ZF-HD dimerization-type domain-containing protein n=1 Tax=Cinchona calisaya TaxID=153742 RepID=A0ABD3B557_9GENT